jgi:hypothetical protein
LFRTWRVGRSLPHLSRVPSRARTGRCPTQIIHKSSIASRLPSLFIIITCFVCVRENSRFVLTRTFHDRLLLQAQEGFSVAEYEQRLNDVWARLNGAQPNEETSSRGFETFTQPRASQNYARQLLGELASKADTHIASAARKSWVRFCKPPAFHVRCTAPWVPADGLSYNSRTGRSLDKHIFDIESWRPQNELLPCLGITHVGMYVASWFPDHARVCMCWPRRPRACGYQQTLDAVISSVSGAGRLMSVPPSVQLNSRLCGISLVKSRDFEGQKCRS